VADRHLPWDPHPRKPAYLLPPGACDSHTHIFGPFDRYPYTPTADYVPYEAPVEALIAMHDAIGVSRGVLVHVSGHGPEGQPTLDALAAYPDRFRAIGVLDGSVTDEELARFDAAGFRGIRVIMRTTHAHEPPLDERLVARIAELGWHVQLFTELPRLVAMADRLRALPAEVVIDHMGMPDVAAGIDHPDFRALRDLLRDGRFWVKVCGPMRFSKEPGPPYSDAAPFARALLEAAPDRCVWATDWPHVRMAEVMPNDGDLVDLLANWCPHANVLRKVLVENPARLYGFPAA